MDVVKTQKTKSNAPDVAITAVLGPSQELPAETPTVTGYDWENGTDYNKILESYTRTGFQATSFGKAVTEINNMLKCRSIPLTEETCDPYEEDLFIKKKTNCTIFLGFTSNMISSGLRDTIRFLVKNKLVDCIVTTAGGVEEDFIKCLAPTYIGDFNLSGKILRSRGINRIGNLLVPNDNYCLFEEWVTPLLDEMLEEQVRENVVWSPSKIIARLGEKINDENSVCYWAWKNSIPIFSPALTDGSLGDMMYFHSYKRPGLIIDILGDLRRLNTMAVKANNTGMIILGGGVIKHHICNANLMRNGADYAVYVNTSSEFDGSDAGARPDEAVSWGKIRVNATPVKLYADATLVFPLLVAQTFAKHHFSNKKNV
ncbi:PREDICTED: probable deoxyhypusine synthase [Papilio xuthus]|uniref:deoxyhypusine synthase n=2 Tax=Papilio xuthus TaxID=66420 RepID=A0A0N0PA07_PAPXU|nr:PREDICTED: probable deoxyhypusine synthase [Papilio xuthus]KPJ04422.1 putative deoxyhypusine synthase [Papilio xuthus]